MDKEMTIAERTWSVRAFQLTTDIPRMLQLRIDIEAADQLGDDTGEGSLRAQFDWLGHDPEQDRWVVEVAGEDGFVGYAWTFAQSPQRSIIHVGVHPAWRRQGLGTELLSRTLARAEQKAATQIVAGARAKSAAGHAFLAARNFTPVGTNRFLAAPVETHLESPMLPKGFSIQSLAELGDVAPVVAGSNGCFDDMWGHRENTELLTAEEFTERMAQFPDSYFPAGIFVLFAPDGEVAGICFNRFEDDGQRRSIDSPGVIPKYRHLGLQRPLVQRSMQWLSQQGTGEYHLMTFGDFEEAVKIYKALGFVLTPENELTEYLFAN